MGNIEIFNRIADSYDTPERIKIAKIIADEIRGKIINGKEKTAIDYGCGTGLVGLQLLDDFKSVIFADASKSMIEQVNNKIQQLSIKNAQALHCDFLEAETSNLATDYIIISQTLIHIKETEAILSKFHGILKDGGRLLIVDFDKNNFVVSNEVHNGFDQKELVGLVKKHGFRSADSETFYYGSKMFMNQDASLFILNATK